jgi:predicted nucleotidyltransferase
MKGPLSRKGSRELLSLLLGCPKRRFSISELAKSAKVPFGSAWNIIRDWEAGGIVETEKVGSTIAVTLGSGPYLEIVKKMMEMPPSPQRMALPSIAKIMKKGGVKEAYLFGSVATGAEKPESDVDIALLKAVGFKCDEETLRIHDAFHVRAVFLEFGSAKELKGFLEGKKHERLV